MRYRVVIIFFLLSETLAAQTYSTVIPDDEIVDFINLDIKRDSIKGIKTIRREMFKLSKDDFYYEDSADFNYKNNNNWQFIFQKHVFGGREINNHLDTVFSRQDVDFFLLQINGTKKRNSWTKKFINSILVDNVELGANNMAEAVMYSYSIPLFSADKKTAIIIKGFFCGLVCGGGAYYVYKKTEGDDWVLLTKVNEWAE